MSAPVTRQPIGILDSGLGGLAVYRAVRQRLPHESVIYVADSRYCPYGAQPEDVITRRVADVTKHLVGLGAKAIAVACNTATVGAVAALRAAHDLPIVGVEPGIKPAALVSTTRTVLLMATPRTLASRSVASLRAQYGTDLHVISQPCPGLVEAVEAGDVSSDTLRELLQQFLRPVARDGADVVILGCTHFIFVAPLIRTLVPPTVTIIEPSEAVAMQLQRRLTNHGLLGDAGRAPEDTFLTTGADPAAVGTVASTLISRRLAFTATTIAGDPATANVPD